VVTYEAARQDVLEVLGRRCSEVLDATTPGEPTNLDFDKEQLPLETLSQRLVEMS
jgi:hypothetical protein